MIALACYGRICVRAKQDDVRVFFYDVVMPLFARLWPASATTAWTWRGFCHVYSLVSARAFTVDAFHGLALVPVADA
jgi:hypothetical protein